MEQLETGAIIAADLGEGISYYRFTEARAGARLESLQPGKNERPIEPITLDLLGRVIGLYRRMDNRSKVNLTQH
jgi:SOS-response transcriptional repressor LexA